MKKIETPPDTSSLLSEPENLFDLIRNNRIETLSEKSDKNYLYWTEVKYTKLPHDITHIKLWSYLKFKRALTAKIIKISEVNGFIFRYNVTDQMLEKLHEFDLNIGGRLESGGIIPEEDKDRFLVSSVMEEAIASSQLEGAATTRKAAKEMLRTERKPKNKSEQMILNNYKTIRLLQEMKDEKMSLEMLLRIHKEISMETLDDSKDEGKLRDNDDIVVIDYIESEVVYTPPEHRYLEKLVQDFCAFANETNEKKFMHPIVRASVLHFLIGYIHPFVDGNGRTARAIFYWYLIKKGYWLIEFMSISRMIIKSQAQYAKAYLFTEYDENDLTYFIQYQLRTMDLSFSSLKQYLSRKIKEKKQLYDFTLLPGINQRQAYILKLISDESRKTLTVKEIQNRFAVTYQTARTDLMGLEKQGLLAMKIIGKKLQQYFKSDMFDQTIKELKNKKK